MSEIYPNACRSAPSSPSHTPVKDPSPNRGQSDFDFGSAPNSPSRSEPGSVSSMPTTPSSAAQANGFIFPHPAFAQFKPNPAALRSFPGFFLSQTGQLPPGTSPTYFLPSNVEIYQMGPPSAAKNATPTSEGEESHSDGGNPEEKVGSEVHMEEEVAGDEISEDAAAAESIAAE